MVESAFNFKSQNNSKQRVAAIGCFLGLLLISSQSLLVDAQSCYLSPQAPAYVLPFAQTYGGPQYGMCKPGWYCPNSDVSNRSTWPALCPPTPACMQLRSDGKWCPPQGVYEPSPCPAGWYCPNSTLKIRCPAGSYCLLGSTAPKTCGPFSNCPAGTGNDYEMVGIFVVLLVDVFVIALLGLYRVASRKSKVTEEANPLNESSANDAQRALSPESGEGSPSVTPTNGILGRSQMNPLSVSRVSAQNDLAALFIKARGDEQPLTFTCKNLSVTIPESKSDGIPAKTLLNGLTGGFKPGHVTAVMGPSGAGKTVFLSTVLDKLNPDWKRAGEFYVNGCHETKDVKSAIGFVPQDDVLHRELTVEENLYFSTETRLPSSWTSDEKAQLRDLVLKALNLDKVRHVQVGDALSRGISGGQRKRCSIGLELCALPSALFLDEPTTGLDASTAQMLCDLLKRLAEAANITVGMVIHQPRVEIWEALDEVLILAPGGKTVYQGPQQGAENYFKTTLGLDFSLGNPADVILDGVANNAELAVETWEKKCLEAQAPLIAAVQEEEQGAADIPSLLLRSNEPVITTGKIPDRSGANFFRQIVLAHNRSLLKQYSQPYTLILDVILATVASTLMGVAALREAYIGITLEEYIVVGPKMNIYLGPMIALFYLLSIASSAAAAGVRTFGDEQIQYWREASSGYNRLAYFLGYTFAGLYRIVLVALHFAVIAYLMWEPVQRFGSFYLVILLMFANVDSQSAMLSMILRPDSAPLLATVIAVFASLLNGYPGIPMINPVSYAWWATEALVSENYMPLSNVYDNSVPQDNWKYKFGQYGLDIGILLVIWTVYRAAAFVFMIVLNREKQR